MAQLDYGIHIYPGDLIQWEFRHQYAIWEWYLRKIWVYIYIYIYTVYIYIYQQYITGNGWDVMRILMGYTNQYGIIWGRLVLNQQGYSITKYERDSHGGLPSQHG